MNTDYSQTLGNFGYQYTLEWNGRNLIFSFLSDKQKSYYEVWMKQTELESINKSPFLAEAQKDRRREKFIRDVEFGNYKFGGVLYQEIQSTERGQMNFVRMLLIEHQPEITEVDVTRLMQDCHAELTAIVSLVYLESTVKVSKVGAAGREKALGELYATLMKPGTEGGLGLTMDSIAAMTDRQKIAILIDGRKEDGNKSDEPPVRSEYSKAEKDMIDARLRAHKLVS